MRKVTSLNIDEEIVKVLKDFNIKPNEWFEKKFYSEFCLMSGKIKLLEYYKSMVYKIEKEIDDLKNECKVVFNGFSDEQVTFFGTIEARLKNGADLNSVRRLFNNCFKTCFDLAVFEQLYNHFLTNEGDLE